MRDDTALARDLLQATARPGPSRGYYYQLLSSIGWTSLPRLPRLPTLILAGDDDPIIPLINARIMHRLIPRSELVIYHGGHLELATDAERMAPIVEAFLTTARLPVSGPSAKTVRPIDHCAAMPTRIVANAPPTRSWVTTMPNSCRVIRMVARPPSRTTA